MSELVLLSALSFTSRLCVRNIDDFSQRRKEDPKPQKLTTTLPPTVKKEVLGQW